MTDASKNLLAIDYPAEFKPGALSAVTTCLRIDPAEKVTLITDRATEPIAAALGAQLAERGCEWNAFLLEDLAARPLIDMPAAVIADMETSQVSIFAVQVQANELHSRMQMTDVVNRRRMRHAHMVNITPEIMCQGMRADFNLVDRLSQKVLDRVRKATRIRATTAAGTDITAEMNPGYKWFKTSGIISQEKWGNLPGGECFTAPGEVNGVFVVDGVAGSAAGFEESLCPVVLVQAQGSGIAAHNAFGEDAARKQAKAFLLQRHQVVLADFGNRRDFFQRNAAG